MASLCVVWRWALFRYIHSFFFFCRCCCCCWWYFYSVYVYHYEFPRPFIRATCNVMQKMCVNSEQKKIHERIQKKILWHVVVKWNLLTAQNQPFASTLTITQTKRQQQHKRNELEWWFKRTLFHGTDFCCCWYFCCKTTEFDMLRATV